MTYTPPQPLPFSMGGEPCAQTYNKMELLRLNKEIIEKEV